MVATLSEPSTQGDVGNMAWSSFAPNIHASARLFSGSLLRISHSWNSQVFNLHCRVSVSAFRPSFFERGSGAGDTGTMVAATGIRNKRSMGPGAIPLSKSAGIYGAGPGESRWSGDSLVPSDGYSSLVRPVRRDKALFSG